MKREFRLTRSVDFERVRRTGKSYPHPFFVLVSLQNGLDQPRVGVSAGRSVGGAVIRNRAKRLLRAAVDSLWPSLRPGYDLVLLARKPLPDAGYWKTRGALEQQLKRAGLVQPQEP